MKRSAALAAAIGLATALSALPAAAQTKWDLPSACPANDFHTENLQQFANDLAGVVSSLYLACLIMAALKTASRRAETAYRGCLQKLLFPTLPAPEPLGDLRIMSISTGC